ncbi:TlpA family protein disulfide reductase [Mucilaginibacter myungsuensis]|uniref:TlpA family protein disulfide reductase n=1 Tax=Mucilaginibacter myungsuensis TaxID=649104 RepID=A0A929KWQ1_9SPHI|nr:TlpA disulfide reductase family protein [Mucilaginibacter myungsuensis]MBE9661855.1 TlpA family protein disulfide reductase [Mucilaginibacter myungsuensis]MDN3599711.1 TlpA disulfide reductase family protein [Mucilaginibacter myungsuensis]
MFELNFLVVVIAILTLTLLAIIVFFLFDNDSENVLTNPQRAALLIGSGIVTEMIVSPLRGYASIAICSAVGFFVYMILTHYFLRRFNNKIKPIHVAALLFGGSLILQAPIRAMNFDSTLISLPDYVVRALGIFAGYFFFDRKRVVNLVNLGLSVMIVAFTFFYGYDMWLNKINYGTFTSNVNEPTTKEIALLTKEQGTINIKKGKVTVLDFWFVGCGACMEEFPEFQQAYHDYKSNSKVQFYSVNVPTPKDGGLDKFQFLSNLNYNFPMAVSTDKSLPATLGIISYPTIVILNEAGTVVYKGDLKGADKKLKALF